jgi:hypothetical protein
MEMTLSTTSFVPDNRLMICLAPALPPESYTLDVTENQLTLCAADDLGAVYGLLDTSRHYLGVAPFWFWNQQQFEPKPFATVPEGRITGPAAAVGEKAKGRAIVAGIMQIKRREQRNRLPQSEVLEDQEFAAQIDNQHGYDHPQPA